MAYRVDRSLALKLLEEDFVKYCKLHNFLCEVHEYIDDMTFYSKDVMDPFHEAEYELVKSMMRWISIAGEQPAMNRLSKFKEVAHASNLIHIFQEWKNDFEKKDIEGDFEIWKN